jgi:hypothetical protein
MIARRGSCLARRPPGMPPGYVALRRHRACRHGRASRPAGGQLLDRKAIRAQVKAPDCPIAPRDTGRIAAPGTSASPKAAQIQPTVVLPAQITHSANQPTHGHRQRISATEAASLNQQMPLHATASDVPHLTATAMPGPSGDCHQAWSLNQAEHRPACHRGNRSQLAKAGAGTHQWTPAAGRKLDQAFRPGGSSSARR